METIEIKEERAIKVLISPSKNGFNCVIDIKNKEIHMYTDAGRFVRPLLRVQDNKLLLTEKMLNDIDLNLNRNKT